MKKSNKGTPMKGLKMGGKTDEALQEIKKHHQKFFDAKTFFRENYFVKGLSLFSTNSVIFDNTSGLLEFTAF